MESYSISGQFVDLFNREIYPARLDIDSKHIVNITRLEEAADRYILPGFVDAHVHIESSMLIPTEFANLAMAHGTVGTVSDPHEIANVLGIKGVEFMINNAKKTPLNILFGVPSCVPATAFETAGAKLTAADIAYLFKTYDLGYLSEMMNYPGVLFKDAEVMRKIEVAEALGKPIDGHAPGLMGKDAETYFSAGISTDHECFTIEEGRFKAGLGVKILIREGSAAKNYAALAPLFNECPGQLMFCSDDKHPDDLIEGHINQLVARALSDGYDVFDVLIAACISPVQHYKMDIGLLRVGDSADFIIANDLTVFEHPDVYIKGEKVASKGQATTNSVVEQAINHFNCTSINEEDLRIRCRGERMNIIKALDGELITKFEVESIVCRDDIMTSDTDKDILKIVVYNRYTQADPAIAFIRGFGLKKGAIASTVAHDCHNIIAVGADDHSLSVAINTLIEMKGGVVAVGDNEVKKISLPVAGLMSLDNGISVGNQYKAIDLFVKQVLSSQLTAPFMTLSFMALLVIPSIKLSDKGLFDGTSFKFIDLFLG